VPKENRSKLLLRRKATSSKGAALLEYGLLLGLIAVVSIGSVAGLGSKVGETFFQVSTQIEDITSNTAPSSDDEADMGNGSDEVVSPDVTIHSFRFRAGRFMNSSQVGYSDSESYGYGTMRSQSSSFGAGTLLQLSTTSVDNMYYTVRHNDPSLFDGGLFECDHGFSALVSEADSVQAFTHNQTGEELVRVSWSGLTDQVRLTEGVETSCTMKVP